MSEIFLKIVNMSISASWLVLAVLLLRLILRKAPKWVRVVLWGIVAVRLICPVSIESIFSLIPSGETISPEIIMDWTPEISTGIGSLDTIVNPIITESFAPTPIASANPLQILIPVCGNFWILGILVMLAYTAVSYFLLWHKVATAVRLRDNIFQSENVVSPFVLGILKPKIYLPFRIDGQNLEYVVAHEQAHIRRKDHWWKPIGFLILALHWFNPLMWLSYILLCRDIELACDEKVIRKMDNAAKADYTQALVACSVNRRRIAACPLAFGEVGVKDRVRSVMHYKKPALWIVVAAIVVCVAVAVCFLTNPYSEITGAALPTATYNKVKLTAQESDTQESSYKVTTFLSATDLSNPGQVLSDKITTEWNTYNAMTQMQRIASSHLWGVVYINTETWNECQQAIGVAIDNPLESVHWISKTGYFGMESVDPSLPATHVKATVYAPHTNNRAPSKISVAAGYNNGDVQITLTATVSAAAGDLTTGSITRGYATYTQNTVTTGSGARVLVVTTNEANNTGYYNGDFFDPTAYWVKDNVFYTLRVFGDAANQAIIQDTLDQLLAEI